MKNLQQIYDANCRENTAISFHLPRLRQLASDILVAVEFGVKRGASSSALLMGAERVVSYDIAETPQARELKEVAGDRWDYRIEDSIKAEIPNCDLLFIDSLHTYDQVAGELKHAGLVSKYIVLHDVTTFGEVGAVGETGKQSWQYVAGKGSCPLANRGIRPAIDEFMIANPRWHIVERRVESHGLLVLQWQ